MPAQTSPARTRPRPAPRAAARDDRGLFTFADGRPTPALVAHLTDGWNKQLELRNRIAETSLQELLGLLDPDMLVGLPELMLLVAGVKPAAKFDHTGPTGSQMLASYQLLHEAGFEVRTEPAYKNGSMVIVGRNVAFADVLGSALAGWPRLVGNQASEAYARATARWQAKTAAVGLVLGYPPLCVAAYAAGDGWFFEDQDHPLPWAAEIVAWWRILGHFRLGSSPEALEEARVWVVRAARRFIDTFPAARRPAD